MNEVWELTVVKAAVPTEFPDAKVDDEYVGPTQFIQSDDPRVVKYAADAVKADRTPGNKPL